MPFENINISVVIFSGQSKLVIQLNRQYHEALRQRIVINYTFTGLTRTETKEYIASRFKACGKSEPPVEDTAYEFIFTTKPSSMAGTSKEQKYTYRNFVKQRLLPLKRLIQGAIIFAKTVKLMTLRFFKGFKRF